MHLDLTDSKLYEDKLHNIKKIWFKFKHRPLTSIFVWLLKKK